MTSLKNSFFISCYIAAIILLLAFVFASYQEMYKWAGCLLALVFVSLAIAMNRQKKNCHDRLKIIYHF